ncbi:bifunctional hydroxymethylpyrimidine kinase/phosphomethylpyrimidine kinase [Persephonella sp.]
MIFKALTIAGSDNSGGAGIQADLKVFSAFGVYGMSAVTSITVQNSLGVKKSYPVSGQILYEQIKAVAEDIPINAFKTGMLQTEENVEAVCFAVVEFGLKNFVCDPVLTSKNGVPLLDPSAVELFTKKLIPLTDIITPNKDEAELLTGIKIDSFEDAKKTAVALSKMGAKTVIIKGGHIPEGDTVRDLVYHRGKFTTLSYPRVNTKHTHGTGCTFSAAITACLAKKMNTIKAVRTARSYVQGAIENAFKTGKGTGSLNHFWTVI